MAADGHTRSAPALIDSFVRTNPDAAYEYQQLAKMAADRRTADAADAPTADGLAAGGSVPVTS